MLFECLARLKDQWPRVSGYGVNVELDAIQIPEPSTLNPILPEKSTQDPGSLNPEPYTLNPKPYVAVNPKS